MHTRQTTAAQVECVFLFIVSLLVGISLRFYAQLPLSSQPASFAVDLIAFSLSLSLDKSVPSHGTDCTFRLICLETFRFCFCLYSALSPTLWFIIVSTGWHFHLSCFFHPVFLFLFFQITHTFSLTWTAHPPSLPPGSLFSQLIHVGPSNRAIQ